MINTDVTKTRERTVQKCFPREMTPFIRREIHFPNLTVSERHDKHDLNRFKIELAK